MRSCRVLFPAHRLQMCVTKAGLLHKLHKLHKEADTAASQLRIPAGPPSAFQIVVWCPKIFGLKWWRKSLSTERTHSCRSRLQKEAVDNRVLIGSSILNTCCRLKIEVFYMNFPIFLWKPHGWVAKPNQRAQRCKMPRPHKT